MIDERAQAPDESRKAGLFSVGYRACDALLFILLLSGPVLVYDSVNHNHVLFGGFHLAVLSVSVVALLGLLRIHIAFAMLALAFFLWTGSSVVRGFLFPPEWSDLFNTFYVFKWAVSIGIEYNIGAYFWKKYSGVEFGDWIGGLIEKIKSGVVS